MKQAEDESAKVEGQPESEQRTKFHPLLSLQLQADIFHLLRKFSDEEEKDDTPEPVEASAPFIKHEFSDNLEG